MSLFNKRNVLPTYEETMEKSIALLYKFNNSYLDIKQKYLKSQEIDNHYIVNKFFGAQLDYMEEEKNNIFENYRRDSLVEDIKSIKAIDDAKKVFWEEFIKVYPKEADKKYSDLFNDDYECNHQEFGNLLIENSEKILPEDSVDGHKLIYYYYLVVSAMENFKYITDYKNILFALGERPRWDNYNEYVLDKKVYEVPISIIKELKQKTVELKKDITILLKDQNFELNELEKGLVILNEKKKEIPSIMVQKIANLKKTISINTYAKQALIPFEHQINVLFTRTLKCENRYGDKISEKIQNIISNGIITIFSGKNISEYKYAQSKARETIFVSNRELNDVLNTGVYFFDVIPTICHLANVTESPIVVPKDLGDHAINSIRYLDEINFQMIGQKINSIAQEKNVSYEQLVEEMSDEEIEDMMLPKSDLIQIHFETNKGMFAYDGSDLINLDTKEAIEFENYEDLKAIFGIIEENQGEVEFEA